MSKFQPRELNNLHNLSQLISRDTGNEIQAEGIQHRVIKIMLYQKDTGSWKNCKMFPGKP